MVEITKKQNSQASLWIFRRFKYSGNHIHLKIVFFKFTGRSGFSVDLLLVLNLFYQWEVGDWRHVVSAQLPVYLCMMNPECPLGTSDFETAIFVVHVKTNFWIFTLCIFCHLNFLQRCFFNYVISTNFFFINYKCTADCEKLLEYFGIF